MKHIKNYESLLSNNPEEEFEGGERVKFKFKGKMTYGEYMKDTDINTDNIVKFFLPIVKYSIIWFDDGHVRNIKKSKIKHLSDMEKNMNKYNL